MATENQLISAKLKDLGGGFVVARSLPTAARRSLGPFVFIDHMGPVDLDLKKKLDVRPHPHIGLATVTYLFEGAGLHRDSLGNRQIIKSGDINWMTAGRGIVHSERTPEDVLAQLNSQSGLAKLHGLQVWVALPKEHEDCDPSFVHHPEEEFPHLELGPRIKARLLIGQYLFIKSPVKTLSRTLYVDIHFHEDADTLFQADEDELGFYLVEGSGEIDGLQIRPRDLFIPADSKEHLLKFSKGSRVAVFGGAALDEPRYMWWNFVSSSIEKIEAASKLWKEQKMGQVPDENEFIPLPSDPLPMKRN